MNVSITNGKKMVFPVLFIKKELVLQYEKKRTICCLMLKKHEIPTTYT